MKKEDIIQFLKENPITVNGVRVDFNKNLNRKHNEGFFENHSNSKQLQNENKYIFVPKNTAEVYEKSKSEKGFIELDGNDILNLSVI